MIGTVDLPGFSDPVRDAQAAFRLLLDAMARPGRVRALPRAAEPPARLGQAMASCLLTLADADAPVWLDAALAPCAAWLTFHTGAAVVADPGTCAFGAAIGLPPLDAFHAGTDEEPERAATVLAEIASFGHGTAFRLSGPGIETTATLRVDGLPQGFAASWRARRTRFPLGTDLILCAGDLVAALPRAVMIEEA